MEYSPTFQSICESRPWQSSVSWSLYWCVERIQSRKTKYINVSNSVVEVIAQFLVLLVAFLAPNGTRSGRRYPAQDVRQCTDYKRQNTLEQHRPKAKVSESIAQVSVDKFAVSKNLSISESMPIRCAHLSSVDIGREIVTNCLANLSTN